MFAVTYKSLHRAGIKSSFPVTSPKSGSQRSSLLMQMNTVFSFYFLIYGLKCSERTGSNLRGTLGGGNLSVSSALKGGSSE